jgi:hypothetical protein
MARRDVRAWRISLKKSENEDDDNLDFARGDRLWLIVVVTNLIRRLHAAKPAFLLDPLSAYLFEHASGLENCDQRQNSSFSTKSAQGRNSN